jgi:imidazolonepropionase-like amidohydrolase
MAIKHPAALHVYWPDMELRTAPRRRGRGGEKTLSIEDQAKEHLAKIRALDDFFQEARAYAKGREIELKNDPASTRGLNPPYEAMMAAVSGRIPVMIHADDLRQIKAALKWSETNHLNMVLVGGRDAPLVAALLAAQKVPVIFEHVFSNPRREEDAYDINFRAAEVLRKTGVPLAFAMGPGSMEVTMARNLPYEAAQAVAFGLPENEALKALTLTPAQILGVADRLGSIEAGKEASLFVSDGGILDIRSHVTRMWIAGKELSLENRHTRLYERYKNRPGP